MAVAVLLEGQIQDAARFAAQPVGVAEMRVVGAVLGEIIAGKNFLESMRGGFGAFLGFLSGVLLKVVYCAVCAGWCIYAFCEVMFK